MSEQLRSNPAAAPQLPDLEVVDVPRESSFKVWSHGYPFRTVRWHFHPEYEIHLVTETSGRSFIGDYIGKFGPGNLVITGPNLPHNWISDVARGQSAPRRSIVVQFTAEFLAGCFAVMPELQALEPMFQRAGRGLEFPDAIGLAVRPLMETMERAAGAEKLGCFFRLLGILDRSECLELASPNFQPRPEIYTAEPLNHVIDHIARNLSEDLSQTELAALSGYSPSAFSRAFQQHTGMTFVRYVNRLRIDRACELLMRGNDGVADICFLVGFNNLSNFNRQFIALKRMPPSAYRRLHRENAATHFDEGAPAALALRPAANGMQEARR